ncbi:MAG: zinc ribbon domain-containing protein [Chloroflexi bacterium]|nr:zinc ribbon domain-containing protein [Chloroflexota bacterium]
MMMDSGSILFLMGLTLLAILAISAPLYNRTLKRIRLSSPQEDRRGQLAFTRLCLQAAENELEELSIDRSANRIAEQDFEARALKLAEELEVLKAEEQQLEIVLRYQAEASRAGAQPEDELAQEQELEALIKAYRRGRSEKAAGLCPNCGQAYLRGDRFCARCGQQLDNGLK